MTIPYQTKDGRHLLTMMPFSEAKYWPRFCQAVGREEWAEKYGRSRDRIANGEALIAELDRVFGSWTLEEAQQRLTAAGCIYGTIAELPEVANDPQLLASGAVTRVPHPLPAASAELSSHQPLEESDGEGRFGDQPVPTHRTVNAPVSACVHVCVCVFLWVCARSLGHLLAKE